MASVASATATGVTTTNQTSMNNMYHLGYQTGRQLRFLWQSASLSSVAFSPNVTTTLTSSLRYGVVELPQRYQKWWIDLVRRDPIHVLVETLLLVFLVLVLLWSRSSKRGDFRKSDEQLTPREEDELLREWKETGRHALVESSAKDDHHDADRRVVHKVEGPYLYVSDDPLTDEDDKSPEIRKVLNCATHDFWGMGASCPSPKTASRAVLEKYGCGSCGPRGFYGTVDYHLALEARMAEVLHTHGSILYSDGASTMTSAVAAFCKRGDVCVVDEAISEPLQTGLRLSRADVHTFSHNNVADLRRVLEKVAATDREIQRRESDRRRFLIVEGLYRQGGDLCPLDQVCALKHEFAYRLILDESLSFGTLGPTGLGAMELFHQKPMVDVEIVLLSLEHAVGSIGGICTGSKEVVEHQRLSGAGYCFSASSPPFAAAAAMAALDERQVVVPKLQSNVAFVYHQLQQKRPLAHPWQLVTPTTTTMSSNEQAGAQSPLLYFGLEEHVEDKEQVVSRLVDQCYQEGLALVKCGTQFRWVVTAAHSHQTLQQALDILHRVAAGLS